jgi:hypothetical protein
LLPGGSHWGAVEAAPHFNKGRWKLDLVAALIAGGIIGYAVRPDGKLEPIDYRRLEESDVPYTKLIKLDTAIDRSTEDLMEKISEWGTAIYVKNPEVPTSPVYIRFNSIRTQEYELTALRGISGGFGCFYIRNDVGVGTLELIISKGMQLVFREDTKTGLYLQPEWAARQGIDKNFLISGASKANGEYAETQYIVPSGKTLYLTQATFGLWATAAADADNNQIGDFWIYDYDELEYPAILGGNGGNQVVFSKPIVVEAGVKVGMGITNRANHTCDLWGACLGYER